MKHYHSYKIPSPKQHLKPECLKLQKKDKITKNCKKPLVTVLLFTFHLVVYFFYIQNVVMVGQSTLDVSPLC